ncbi:MAG: DUF2312 domain-containing protein [Bacteroidota bacterium]
MGARRDIGNGSNVGRELQQIVEAIEALEAEKAAIAEQIKDKKSEAKARGFDVRVINAVLKLRRMTRVERREHQALIDIYLAALGDLDSPISDWARKKLNGESLDDNDEPPTFEPGGENDPQRPLEDLPPPSSVAEDTLEEAFAKGVEAAGKGIPLIKANPYPANSKQRIKFDEGYCSATGTDGFDLPPQWQRSKPKKGKDKGADAGGYRPNGSGEEPDEDRPSA